MPVDANNNGCRSLDAAVNLPTPSFHSLDIKGNMGKERLIALPIFRKYGLQG